jgi:hypothetical protein
MSTTARASAALVLNDIVVFHFLNPINSCADLAFAA